MIKEKLNPTSSTKDLLVDEFELVLYNDDFNTFDDVIEALIEVCDLDIIQAEQITLIVHVKGKCGVISGDYYKLKPMYDALCLKRLTVEIQ